MVQFSRRTAHALPLKHVIIAKACNVEVLRIARGKVVKFCRDYGEKPYATHSLDFLSPKTVPPSRPSPVSDRQPSFVQDAMTLESSKIRVACIGAGFAGLALAKSILDGAPGAELTIYEANEGVGGVWLKVRHVSDLRPRAHVSMLQCRPD